MTSVTKQVGMNLITSWPGEGKVVGIVHMDGPEAGDRWIKENPEAMQIIKERGKHV